MRTTINIQPINMHVDTASQLVFQITSVKLGRSASFHWELLGNNGLITQGQVEMEGEDYQGWNNDDPYVKNWLLKQLNLVEFIEIITAPETPISELEEGD